MFAAISAAGAFRSDDAGLILFAAFGWWWADPAAALAVAWFAVPKGREAWHRELACDD